MIRIFIADDHEIVRNGLKSVLSRLQDMEVIGEAGTGRETVSGCIKSNPDVLVLDLDMPGLGGMDILEQLRSACPDTRILILTMHDNEEYAIRGIRAGASGFILKASPHGVLPEAIRAVYAGKKYISASIKDKLVMRSFGNDDDDLLQALSNREIQVLKQLAIGKKLIDIADNLGLSVSTVGSYKRRIKEKLELNTNEELIRFSRDHGIV